MLRWLEKKRDEEELRKREKYAYCLVFVLSHGKGEQVGGWNCWKIGLEM